MIIKKFPNGTLELKDRNLIISGLEASIIPVSDIEVIICREGKKSIFSRNPPAIVELSYISGLNLSKIKIMILKEEIENMNEMIRLIKK